MFKIDQHIEFLLLNHSCVIVPGFGGFVVHKVPARFDNSDGMMLPPTTTVGFNPQLVLNDSLLIQSFVEAYDMSYPEAQREVESETQELRGLIADNGQFEIHSVGTLSLNSDGNYEFEPCEAGILVPRLYGLSGIETNDEEAFVFASKAKPSTLPVTEAVLSEPEVVASADDEEDDDTIHIRRSTIRRIAVACAALLFIVAIPFITTGGNPNKMLSAIDFSFITNLIPKSEVKIAEKSEPYKVSEQKETAKVAPQPAAKVEEQKPEATEVPTEAKPQIEPVAEKPVVQAEPATPVYTIVLAAQVSKVNAEEFVSTLTRKGMKDVRMIGEGKGRKVVMGSYKTEEEAQQGRRSIVSNPELASAWVMKMK